MFGYIRKSKLLEIIEDERTKIYKKEMELSDGIKSKKTPFTSQKDKNDYCYKSSRLDGRYNALIDLYCLINKDKDKIELILNKFIVPKDSFRKDAKNNCANCDFSSHDFIFNLFKPYKCLCGLKGKLVMDESYGKCFLYQEKGQDIKLLLDKKLYKQKENPQEYTFEEVIKNIKIGETYQCVNRGVSMNRITRNNMGIKFNDNEPPRNCFGVNDKQKFVIVNDNITN